MNAKLTSITLNTPHLEDMLSFYKILGVKFMESKVDKGSQVQRALVGDFEFSLYSINLGSEKPVPRLQLSFEVTNLDEKMAQILRVPNAMSILDPTQMPDGKKAIVLDPDGHSIELRECV